MALHRFGYDVVTGFMPYSDELIIGSTGRIKTNKSIFETRKPKG